MPASITNIYLRRLPQCFMSLLHRLPWSEFGQKKKGLKSRAEETQQQLDSEKHKSNILSQEDATEISDLKSKKEDIEASQKDQERRIDEMKREAYNRGKHDGFSKSVMQTTDAMDKLKLLLAEEKRENKEAKIKFKQSEDVLRQTIDDFQRERATIETCKAELSKISNDSKKLQLSLADEKRMKEDAQTKLTQSEIRLRETIDDYQKEKESIETYKAQLIKASNDTEKLTASLKEERRKTEEARTKLTQSEAILRSTLDDLQKDKESINAELKKAFRRLAMKTNDQNDIQLY